MSSNQRMASAVPKATQKLAPVLAHPSIVALIERAAPVGSVSPEEVRQAVADADVAPPQLKPLMAHLSGLGITVVMPVQGRAVAAASPRKTATAKTAVAKKAAPAKKAAAKTAAKAEVPVIGPDGKKILPDLPDEQFEKDVKVDPTIVEDEKEASKQSFVVSAADDTDEPEQQVMVAGATADPVKDYLKQIGKVPLLNAEMEVELAKRIEAGLFAEEKLAKGGKITPEAARRARVDRRRRCAAPRTTSSRPTCASSSRSPSATPAAACSSWT